MKKSSMAALIVTVCIIAPVIVGYVMPTGETEHKGYESTNILNVTGELANDKLPIYNAYSGANNMIYSMAGDYFAMANRETSAVSAYPSMTVEYWKETTWTGGTGPVPVTDGGVTYRLSVYTASSSTYWTDNYNNRYQTVYVNSNGATNPDDLEYTINGINNNTGMVDFDLQGVRLQGSGQYYMTISAMNNDRYTDLSYGYQIHDVSWRNGYTNQTVWFILRASSNPSDANVQFSFGNWPNYPIVQIKDGNWQLNQTADNSPQTLGSAKAYEYVLVEIDSYLHKCKLSGLIGMTGFNDDWTGKVAKTVEVGTMAYSPIISIDVHFSGNYESSLVGWFMPRAMILTGYGVGLVNSTMDPSGYCDVQNAPWEVRLENPAAFGESLKFYGFVNLTFNVNKTDGTILVNGVKVPIRGMIIDYIPYHGAHALEINGIIVSEALTESPTIQFYGDWWVHVYFTQLSEYSYKTYDWEPGGFGIDATGFYSIGLLSSVGCAVAGGLSGRRSGEHAGIVLLTSAICGLIYIILLIG